MLSRPRTRALRPVVARVGVALTRVLCILSLLLLPRVCRADGDRSRDLDWDPEWPTFRWSEYLVSAAAGAESLYAFYGLTPPAKPHWVGGILFDDAFRSALRLHSESARSTVQTLSYVTVGADLAIAVGIDSLIVPLARRKPRVAWQLLLMDAEAIALSTGLTTTGYETIGRARPSYADCQKNPAFDPLCNSGATADFPSGHTNIAFTSAGLSCANHAYLALYGSPAADAAACAGMLTLGAATGLFRVMGDRHYMTDVLTGGLIGFGFGYSVPTVLHYTMRSHPEAPTISLTPMGGPSTVGMIASGVF